MNVKLAENKIKTENKITCFTINAFDDDYYKNGLPVDEVSRNIVLHNKFNFGKVFDFKVFDYNHPLVIECKEKYKEFFDREDIIKSVKTDVVRLYILSKLPYHLYIDDDVLLLDDFEIKDEEDYFLGHCGCFNCIYNGSNLDIFKEMLEIYPFDDKQLDEYLEEIKSEKLKENFLKRYDYCLMKCYKPLKKFIKYNSCLIEVKHYYYDSIRENFYDNVVRKFCPKKIYLIFEEDVKINIEKENYYCFFTKDQCKHQPITNYCKNYYYFYKKIFTKSYIINEISKLFKIKNIKNNNKIIEIELENNYSFELKNNKITCFTINAFDNGYYKDGLPVDEANKKMWLYNVKNYSHIFDFKVFDYTHPLVIECKEKYKDFFEREDIWLNIKSDIIKFYILSKLPYHLYIDDDVVLQDECSNLLFSNFNNASFDNGNLGIIYNGSDLDVFKEMLDFYPFKDEQLKNNSDYNSYIENEKRLNKERNMEYKFNDNFLLERLRIDCFLFEKYIPFKKYKKYMINLMNLHYYTFFDSFTVDRATSRRKIIIIDEKYAFKEKDALDYLYYGYMFIIMIDKPEWRQRQENVIYACKHFFTEEYLIENFKKNNNIKEVIKVENQISLIL